MRRVDWIVYAKRPFGGPAQVFAHLGRYGHRVAIANSRLKTFEIAPRKRLRAVHHHAKRRISPEHKNTIPITPRKSRRAFVQSGFNEVRSRAPLKNAPQTSHNPPDSRIARVVIQLDMTDFEWSVIEPLVPNKARGFPRVDDRRVFERDIPALAHRRAWADIPELRPATCVNRFNHRDSPRALESRRPRSREVFRGLRAAPCVFRDLFRRANLREPRAGGSPPMRESLEL
jgi:transposase